MIGGELSADRIADQVIDDQKEYHAEDEQPPPWDRYEHNDNQSLKNQPQYDGNDKSSHNAAESPTAHSASPCREKVAA
jgi:hypothetical protein